MVLTFGQYNILALFWPWDAGERRGLVFSAWFWHLAVDFVQF